MISVFVLFGVGLLISFVPLFSHDTSFFSKRRNPCLNYMCQKLVVLKQILTLIFTQICIVLKPFSLLFIKQMHALNRSYLFGQFYNLH